MMYKQVELPYAFGALEPHIDTLTMETHYAKHHAAYTKNLNDAAEKAGVADREIEAVLAGLDAISDEQLRLAVRNNGGGFYNHNLYFSTMMPNGGGGLSGAFAGLLNKEFGSFDAFQEQISKAAIGRFASGWAWLSANKTGKLLISSSPNQDNPIIEGTGFKPILSIDVWEHAYYLKYKNLRAEYVKAYFNVINWSAVIAKYDKIIG